MVRALYALRDVKARRDVIGGDALSTNSNAIQNAIGKHSNMNDVSWGRNQQGHSPGVVLLKSLYSLQTVH